MMVDNFQINTDANKRAVYVGMTRAKNSLYIHYNGCKFDTYKNDANDFVEYDKEYDYPNELIIQLGHSHVVLNFFKNKTNIIESLRSGTKLEIENEYVYVLQGDKKIGVAKLSQNIMPKIIETISQGYEVQNGTIRFIVYWKGKEDVDECLVILPNIIFKKTEQKNLLLEDNNG